MVKNLFSQTMTTAKSPFRSVSRRQKLRKSVHSIWTYSRKLFSVSGVNGISHIALAKTNGRRALWIGLFTFSVVGWFFQTTTLLEYYYKYPTIVKIEVEREKEMDFPAITICNVNKIRRSQYCKEFPERCVSQKNIQLSEEDIFEVTFEFFKRGEKLLLGHQINDTIVSCEFTGKPNLDTDACLTYFSYIYDPHLGNCILLSSLGHEPLKVTEEDALQDIEEMDLFLNVEDDEYLDPNSQTPGMIMTIHDDLTYPHVLAHAMHVFPKHDYTVAIEKNTVYLLPAPYKTNCTNYHNLKFDFYSELQPTPRICIIECLEHHQHDECGHGFVSDSVVLFADEIPYDPDQATSDDRKCANEMEEVYSEYCSSLCGVPCHDVHFTVQLDDSPKKGSKVLNESVIEEYRRRTSVNKTLNLIHVKIHFLTMEHRTFRHSPEYSTEELFSYLGGITGGWLGISLLEFCSFVEGMVSVLIFSFRYCKPNKKNKKKKRSRTPRKIVPICQCGNNREDYGSLLLAIPVDPESPGTMQVVPFDYYY